MKNKRVWKLFILISIFTFVLTLSLTLGFNVFAAEETTQATQPATDKFIDWVKNLDMSAIRGYAAGLIAYLSANLLVIIGLAIKIILAKAQQLKNDENYKELENKLDTEHKKQMQELTDGFTKELESINQAIVDELKRQNSEKRINAKESVEQMKKHLDDINIELDK